MEEQSSFEFPSQDQMEWKATSSSVILEAEAICKEVDEFKVVLGKEKEKASTGPIDLRIKSEAASNLIEKVTSIIKSSLEKRRKTLVDSTFDTQTPEQKVFTNSLIVKLMFGFLNHVDLLHFRLVSKLWEREARALLLSPSSNELLKVGFIWCESSQSYQNYIGALEEFHEEFSTWISSGTFTFPCTQFSFTGGDLDSPSSSSFLTEYGRHIQSLIYEPKLADDFSIPHFLGVLRKLLIEWAPKIKNLTLLSIPPTPDTMTDPDISFLPKGAQLPSLEKFIAGRSSSNPEEFCPIVRDILKAAPNFKPFRRLNFKFTREIIAAGKFHMFKELPIQVNLSNEHQRHLWSEYVEAGPRLQMLDMQILPNKYDQRYAVQLAREVQVILESSRETLEEIQNLKNYKFCQFIKFPLLEKVTRISSGKVTAPSERTECWKLLENGQNLSDVFPNLELLDVQAFNPLFEQTNSSPSVRELRGMVIVNLEEVEEEEEEEEEEKKTHPLPIDQAMENLRNFYPLLKIFRVSIDIKVFPMLCNYICLNLRELEVLHVSIGPTLPPGPPFDIVEKVESSITGISPILCRQMRRSSSWTKADDCILQQLENEEIMESNPSLRNMTKLKKLEFEFYEGWPILTHVSHFYAFELMAIRQNLQVSVNGRLFTRDFYWDKEYPE